MKKIRYTIVYHLTLLLIISLQPCYHTMAQVVTTVAGNGTPGFSGDGGPATSARSSGPYYLSHDRFGNIFFSELANARIRKIDTFGIITTVAGTGISGFSGDGGPATAAQITSAEGIAVDDSGNIYFGDLPNYCVRKISPAGIITRFAGNGTSGSAGDGGPATAAMIKPTGVLIDKHGNIYISEFYSQKIRIVSPSGIINTIAGIGTGGYSGDGGPATSAQLKGPQGMALDTSGNLYFADLGNRRIRKIDPTGTISTIAGIGGSGAYVYSGDGGPATAAAIIATNLKTDTKGNIYLADCYNARIRKIDPAGIITTIAGTGTEGFNGDGHMAIGTDFDYPHDLFIHPSGDMYICDFHNVRVRKIPCITSPNAGTIKGEDSLCQGLMTTLVGNVPGGIWTSTNTLVATISTTGVVSGISNGTTDILHIITNTCGSDTVTFSLSVHSADGCATSISTAEISNQLTIYPNPNNGSFSMHLSSGTNEEALITVTNILGQKIKEFTMNTNKETLLQLDVPLGVYYLKIVTRSSERNEKIIVGE